MSDRLDQLKKLHEADPADPFCTYGIALEHAKAGRRDDAIAWLDKTLELDGQYCYAYFQKGKILSEMGREDEARAVLELGMAVGRKAGNPDALHAAEEMATLLETI
ncbi:MAG: tetratricopeptide repeat protein [Phycisphaeraceae bacterium]